MVLPQFSSVKLFCCMKLIESSNKETLGHPSDMVLWQFHKTLVVLQILFEGSFPVLEDLYVTSSIDRIIYLGTSEIDYCGL